VPCSPFSPPRRPPPAGAPPAAAVGSIVDVQIVDRDRAETLSTWRHRGASYVAGRPGDRYAVRLTNRSPGRVLVVLSVDGVNAVSGDTAAVSQTGYVLAPWQTAEITGWRKSYSEAAAFYFTALPDSYAARTGRPDNVGVIGAAVFRERVPSRSAGWFSRRLRSRRRARRTTGSSAARAAEGVGRRVVAARRRRRAARGALASRARAARREEARHRPRRAGVLADDADRIRAQLDAAGRGRADPLRQLRQPARRRHHPARPAAAAPARPVPVVRRRSGLSAADRAAGRAPADRGAVAEARSPAQAGQAAQQLPDALGRRRHLDLLAPRPRPA
jgi:hypothetical protein